MSNSTDNSICKLLPLSYPTTEVENWLERNEIDDFIMLSECYYSTEIKDERGLNIMYIKTFNSLEFYIYYNPKFKKFTMFYKKKKDKDTSEYCPLASWGVTIEDCEWFDPSL